MYLTESIDHQHEIGDVSLSNVVKEQIMNKVEECCVIEELPAEITANHEDTFNRLAQLPEIDYEIVRKKEAENLAIRVSVLDNKVERIRREKNLIESDCDGDLSAIFPNVEPWPETAKGEELLRYLIDIINEIAILPQHSDISLALWIIFTWCIDEFDVAPILFIGSPEKQCGKTTVLSLVGKLVRKPLQSSNISSAALYRTIEKYNPSLIIDEADTFIKNDKEDLRGILNSGHTRENAYVIRVVGDTHEPKRFSTWGAKAIAGIGKLPDTLHDRSIVVNLRRKQAHEKVKRLRNVSKSLFEEITRKLLRFAQDNENVLRISRPNLPHNISDRAADNWEPLLAIAELCGPEFHSKALKAAQSLSGHEQDALSKGTELLNDIKNVFDEEEKEKISTAALIIALCKDEEMPWATYNNNKSISPRQLSRLLKDYGVQSKTVRLSNGSTPKGFDRSQFEDPWLRYLSTPILSATTTQDNEIANFSVADSKEIGNNLSYIGPLGSSETGLCVVVADVSDYMRVEI